MEMLNLVENAWISSDRRNADDPAASAALVGDPEKFAPATLKRFQEIVQEHRGYAEGEVFLRVAAFVR